LIGGLRGLESSRANYWIPELIGIQLAQRVRLGWLDPKMILLFTRNAATKRLLHYLRAEHCSFELVAKPMHTLNC
jgi:hypothetical protein